MVDAVRHGDQRTTTFVRGHTTGGLVAPLSLSRPSTARTFLAYAEPLLTRVLRPGSVVGLGNFAAHTVGGVREAIAATGGTVIDVPAASPAPNPTKLKTLLRRRRTRTDLWHASGELLDRLDPDGCRRYVEHAGIVRSLRNGLAEPCVQRRRRPRERADDRRDGPLPDVARRPRTRSRSSQAAPSALRVRRSVSARFPRRFGDVDLGRRPTSSLFRWVR